MSDKKNDFRSSFKAAKSSGKKTFSYKGNKYNTRTASERASTLSNSALKKAVNKSTFNMYVAHGVEGKPKSKSLRKSTKEINNSYLKERKKRNPNVG